MDQVTIIIRSAGERTADLCKQLVLEQGVPERCVTEVSDAPFSVTLRKSLLFGLEHARKWTFCVDADVLLRPDSIGSMLEFAEQQPEQVCEIQGLVLCKYFGGPRPAGNHLYRTALLERVIANIPQEGVDIRPEYHALQTMKAQGFPWISVPFLVGLHDFEQYHRDIFRKSFIQAHKHPHFTELFVSVWRAAALQDDDYRVALAGFARGIEHGGPVFIDARDEMFRVSIDALGLEEKSEAGFSSWDLDRIESLIRDWREPEIYLKTFPDRLGLDECTPAPHNSERTETTSEFLRRRYTEYGLAGALLNALGWRVEKLGRLLQTVARRR